MLIFLVLPVLDLLTSTVIAAAPSRTLWRLVALLLHGTIVLYAIATTNGGTVHHYSLRTMAATKFFAACHFLWFTDPLTDYRHELDKIPPRERSFPYRVYWAGCAVANHRGIGSNRPVTLSNTN